MRSLGTRAVRGIDHMVALVRPETTQSSPDHTSCLQPIIMFEFLLASLLLILPWFISYGSRDTHPAEQGGEVRGLDVTQGCPSGMNALLPKLGLEVQRSACMCKLVPFPKLHHIYAHSLILDELLSEV